MTSFNSTRCIRNFRNHKRRTFLNALLSTPHGALGAVSKLPAYASKTGFQLHTVHQEPQLPLHNTTRIRPFNSTRCIRSNSFQQSHRSFLLTLSTPHGALGAQRGMGKPIACRTLSTPHGALGACILSFAWALLSVCFQLHTVHQEPCCVFVCFVVSFAFNSTRCIRSLKLPH